MTGEFNFYHDELNLTSLLKYEYCIFRKLRFKVFVVIFKFMSNSSDLRVKCDVGLEALPLISLAANGKPGLPLYTMKLLKCIYPFESDNLGSHSMSQMQLKKFSQISSLIKFANMCIRHTCKEESKRKPYPVLEIAYCS